jgi:hypothetical protein
VQLRRSLFGGFVVAMNVVAINPVDALAVVSCYSNGSLTRWSRRFTIGDSAGRFRSGNHSCANGRMARASWLAWVCVSPSRPETTTSRTRPAAARAAAPSPATVSTSQALGERNGDRDARHTFADTATAQTLGSTTPSQKCPP